MNPDVNSPQLDGITYHDELPIAWEFHSQLPGEGEIHRLNRSSAVLLQMLLMLDEPTLDNEEETEGTGSEHWRRLEAKVDILLNLVGELLTADAALPAAHVLQLGVAGLCVQGVVGNPSQLGQIVKVRLFLDPMFPRPLQLFARIGDVREGSLTLAYCELDAPVQDLLDRYVFRQHRRAIALARRSESS
jgi:Atypical PilZ domain, cyclic di-GMP receptor